MANERTQDIELGLKPGAGSLHSDGRDKRAILTISTDKGSRGITSTATVFWEGDSFRSHAFGLGGGDFSRTLRTTAARATQKAIDTQHAEVFTDAAVAELIAAAKAHYPTAAAA